METCAPPLVPRIGSEVYPSALYGVPENRKEPAKLLALEFLASVDNRRQSRGRERQADDWFNFLYFVQQPTRNPEENPFLYAFLCFGNP